MNRFVAVISGVLLVLFGGFVALLWGLGLFDSHRSNAQVVAAALALVGGLVATSLTFVGVLLKNSIDERTLRQTQDTEARLKLETSIRAVELLTQDGKAATRTRQAGALFVLASLDQLDFSLALLREIWEQRQISASAAVWVVDRALMSGDASVQERAAGVLEANARDLINDSSCYAFPNCVDLKWRTDLPMLAREALLSSLLEVAAAKPRNEWTRECINALLLQFDLIREADPDSHIRNGALLCLDVLLESPFYKGQDTQLYAPTGEVDTAVLREKAARLLPGIGVDVAQSIMERVDSLRADWLTEGESPDEGS